MTDLGYYHVGDRIVIERDPGRPVELEDLSDSFAALSRIYGRHYRQQDQKAPRLDLTWLETVSVIMEVAPLAMLMGALTVMDNGIVVADLTNRLWRGAIPFSRRRTTDRGKPAGRASRHSSERPMQADNRILLTGGADCRATQRRTFIASAGT